MFCPPGSYHLSKPSAVSSLGKGRSKLSVNPLFRPSPYKGSAFTTHLHCSGVTIPEFYFHLMFQGVNIRHHRNQANETYGCFWSDLTGSFAVSFRDKFECVCNQSPMWKVPLEFTHGKYFGCFKGLVYSFLNLKCMMHINMFTHIPLYVTLQDNTHIFSFVVGLSDISNDSENPQRPYPTSGAS